MIEPNRRKFLSILATGFVVAGAGQALAADTALQNLTQGTLPKYFYGTNQSNLSRKFNATMLKNVLDYGASNDGTNATATTAAIQAAVNDTNAPFSSLNRGTIYFPPGTYALDDSITFNTDNINISFYGDPGATLSGNIAKPLLKRAASNIVAGVHEIYNLSFLNSNASGKGIELGQCVAGQIINCQFGVAGTAIQTDESQAVTVMTCGVIGSTIGIMAGNATAIINCDITGCTHAIRHYNAGLIVHGGRLEVNTVAIMLGMNPAGSNVNSISFDISGVSMEANQTGITGNTCGGGKISGLSIGGGVAMAYGIRLLNCFDTVISGINVSGSASPTSYTGAGISLEGCGRVILQACSVNITGGTRWNVATGLSSYQLIQCDTEVTVAQLPTSPVNGTILPVSDASVSTFGATPSGGGSNHVNLSRSAGVWRII